MSHHAQDFLLAPDKIRFVPTQVAHRVPARESAPVFAEIVELRTAATRYLMVGFVVIANAQRPAMKRPAFDVVDY